jgi:hypothetical protein
MPLVLRSFRCSPTLSDDVEIGSAAQVARRTLVTSSYALIKSYFEPPDQSLPTTGALLGTLERRDSEHLSVLTVGNGSPHGGGPFEVYVASGPVDEGDGLFGSMAVPEPST